MGYKAVSKGRFFEISKNEKLSEVSIVPLVSPMIAGPATITAALSFTAQNGLLVTSLALTLAVTVNLLIMLLYKVIHDVLSKFSLMGPLIRLTGLIVATIAVQMMFDGLGEWAVLVFP
jgi:multiple antibiotic resistance protein